MEDYDKSTVLERAAKAVEDRRTRYGPPNEHFARTIGMLNALFAHKLREPLVVEDWPAMMMIDKLARRSESPDNLDHLIDIAGYARTAELLHEPSQPLSYSSG